MLYRMKCLAKIWREEKATDVTRVLTGTTMAVNYKSIIQKSALIVNPSQQGVSSHQGDAAWSGIYSYFISMSGLSPSKTHS